jgi:hypothetical protein
MSSPRAWYRDLCLAVFTVAGFALPFAAAILVGGRSLVRGGSNAADAAFALFGLALFTLGLTAVAKVYRHARAEGPTRLRVAYEVLVLGWLPAWGLFVNHFMLKGTCTRSSCDVDLHRPFAEPWVIAPALLHVAVSLAFALSRRRPARLRPLVETTVLAAMIVGMALHAALQLQLGAVFVGLGLLVVWVGLPVVSPTLAAALFAVELRDRLRRRGAEESERTATVGEGAYRAGEVPADPNPAPVLSETWGRRALAWSPVLLGAYAVLSGVATQRAAAGVMAFTQTCDHVFSQLPVRVIPGNCHYLCTVAARGHTWIVRPERLGVRGGATIVVNRQLAVANAFEDLLHTRWPRFGRFCRATYDRFGLPVSRLIRWRAVADAIYLAMKPAEWCFYAALLALDPGDPEARIARMYRP